MATSASQTYISKLGFQDRDRSNERHGLACEYLFERMMELEVAPRMLSLNRWTIEQRIQDTKADLARYEKSKYYESEIKQAKAKLQNFEQQLTAFNATSSPESYMSKARDLYKAGDCLNVPITSRSYVNGFADVLIADQPCFLGEVKITKEPAENVLQQVNFYLNHLQYKCVQVVYILTDYDPGDLKRLCVGTKIKVYRLGQVFEQWLANRTNPETEEL